MGNFVLIRDIHILIPTHNSCFKEFHQTANVSVAVLQPSSGHINTSKIQDKKRKLDLEQGYVYISRWLLAN